ncbi:hypothetical protein F5B19DRAFT_175506 [Rostrohypoxylon terebratum]|nr:hypothetical protein F5B19DRAFT_175506 [Rostrohypoxylon terebratum]
MIVQNMVITLVYLLLCTCFYVLCIRVSVSAFINLFSCVGFYMPCFCVFPYFIFVPGILNATTGLVTTLLNIYTAKDGAWSPTAIATVALITIVLGVMVTGFSVYALLIRGLSNKG